MLFSNTLSARQCLNPITLPNYLNAFCKITTFPMSSQSKCVGLVQEAKNKHASLRKITSIITDLCDPISHCDFNLGKYMIPELEDDIFLYEVKIRTV